MDNELTPEERAELEAILLLTDPERFEAFMASLLEVLEPIVRQINLTVSAWLDALRVAAGDDDAL
jgi:hypothetical protein